MTGRYSDNIDSGVTVEAGALANPDLSDGLPQRQRNWAMSTMAMAICMVVLDSEIANVALPTIARSVGTSPATSIWIVNSYQIALVVFLLPISSIGDIVGYNKVYKAGLALFTAASLCCALSHSLSFLVIARFIQGVGAAAITGVNTALIRTIYPHKLLGRGLGLNAMVIAVSAAIAPTLAAGILSIATWPWLFAVNVPIGIMCLGISMRTLSSRTGGTGHRFDVWSGVLSALTFGLVLSGIDGLGHQMGLIAVFQVLAGTIIAIVFVRRQLSQPAPMFAVDLLRESNFALSVGTSVCCFTAQMAAYVSMPFYLQNVLGYTQVQTGLFMSPWPLGTVITAPIAGRLSERHPTTVLAGIGLGTFTLGLVSLALLPQHPSGIAIMWRMAVCGLGYGFFQTPNTREMVASAPRERAGAANGILGAARLTGLTFGASLVALIFGLSAHSENVVVMVVAACIAASAVIISSLRIRRRAPRTAFGEK